MTRSGPMPSKATRVNQRPEYSLQDARWQQIRQRIDAAGHFLAHQGSIVSKKNRQRRDWVLRYRRNDGQGWKLASIYICGEHQPELLAKARQLLDSIREPARLSREIAVSTRCAKFARAFAQRLTRG